MTDDLIREQIARALDPARSDPAFQRRIAERIEKDRPILDRLAEQDHGFGPIEVHLPQPATLDDLRPRPIATEHTGWSDRVLVCWYVGLTLLVIAFVVAGTWLVLPEEQRWTP